MRCLLFYIVILFSCLLVTSSVHSQLQKIYLHPKASGTEKQSQFVDSIRFIPLEVKEGIDIGRFNYVTVAANHFLIIDYPEKKILIYSKTGAFLRKINYQKLTDGFSPDYDEYSNQLVFFGENKNYALTPKDLIQIKLDWNNPRNKKYFKKYRIDLNDTTFTIQKDSPNEKDILYAQQYSNDAYWLKQITISKLFKDSLDYELKLYKNNQFAKGFFPYNRINEPRFLYSGEEETVVSPADKAAVFFVTRPFCDTIYKMTGDSLLPVCQVVLPLENSLPPSFYTKPFKNKTERENFRRNNGWMFHQIYRFYETPQFFLFAIGYFTNHEQYLYQKSTNTTYKTKSIKADSSQYNLSLLESPNIERQGDKFYKTQKAGDLLRFFEQHKSVAVPKELQSFFDSRPNENSPVIVEFKLKN